MAKKYEVGAHASRGSVLFDRLIVARGLSNQGAADQLNTARPVVWSWRTGASQPSTHFCEAIEQWSRDRTPDGELGSPQILTADWLSAAERKQIDAVGRARAAASKEA